MEGVRRGWRALVVDGVRRGGRRSWRASVVEGVGRGGRWSWRASVVEGVGRGGRWYNGVDVGSGLRAIDNDRNDHVSRERQDERLTMYRTSWTWQVSVEAAYSEPEGGRGKLDMDGNII